MTTRRIDPGVILSPVGAFLAVGLGVVAGGVVALAGQPLLAPVVGWLVAAAFALTWVWRRIWPEDPVATKQLAEREAESRTTDSAVLVAAVVSLGLVVLALVRSSTASNAASTAIVVLAVVDIVASWCLVNTVFALKYARLYYVDEDGGIDFGRAAPPRYSDFAYLAFTVGMSFAVSDTEIQETAIRRAVLGHALLSYIFATGILAVAVNVVTNLAQS
jgi:uncharacterized membrane protein